ncbi:MAG: hypothetical protein M4579_001853 [Chaenotheca gracillima]|nr:MAG: hypothetical protein M4579_001853 [Chaenotheca gracillima]
MAQTSIRPRPTRSQDRAPTKIEPHSNPSFAPTKQPSLTPIIPSTHTEVTAQAPRKQGISRSRSQLARLTASDGNSRKKEAGPKKEEPLQVREIEIRKPNKTPQRSPMPAKVALPAKRVDDDGNSREAKIPQKARENAPRAPTPSQNRNPVVVNETPFTANSRPDTALSSRPGLSHKNSTKWRIFGGFFGKKSEDLTPPTSSHQARQLSPSVLSSQDEKSPLNKKLPTPPSSPVQTRTVLTRSRSRLELRRKAKADRERPEINRSKTDAPPRTTPLPKASPRPEKPTTISPLLQVDIPNVEMERYSVMFSGLLKTSSSSLLARRQATLDRLKTTRPMVEQDSPPLTQYDHQTNLKLPNRRASSPAESQSPSFTFLPTGPTHLTPAATPPGQRPSPLQRSHTIPLDVPSSAASASTFGARRHKLPHNEQRLVVMIQSPSSDKKVHLQGAPSPAFSRVSFSSRDSIPSAHATVSSSQGDEFIPPPVIPRSKSAANMPSPSEPTWEMVTRPSKPRSSPRMPGDATNEAEALIRSAADASIERQITLSRRQLLLPIAPSSERVVDRQPMTAIVVDSQPGLAGRKSQRIEFDSA